MKLENKVILYWVGLFSIAALANINSILWLIPAVMVFIICADSTKYFTIYILTGVIPVATTIIIAKQTWWIIPTIGVFLLLSIDYALLKRILTGEIKITVEGEI